MGLRKKSTKDLVHPGGDGDAPISATPKKEKRPKKERPPKEAKEGRPPLKDVVKSKPFIGGVCITVGLLLAFVAVPLLQAQLARTVPVVVLAEGVPAGVQLTPDMLKSKEMGMVNLPVGAVLQVEDAVGRYLTVPALPGDILTTMRLSDQLPTDDPALSNLPAGKLAMSASIIDLDQSVSSKLRAGDVIQLFAAQNNAATDASTTQAPPELQRLEVLAVTNSKALDIETGAISADVDAADGDRQIATVTVAVNSRQALVLAGLNHDATIYAALVTRGEPAAKAAALEQQELFFLEDDTPGEAPAPAGDVPTAPAQTNTGGMEE